MESRKLICSERKITYWFLMLFFIVIAGIMICMADRTDVMTLKDKMYIDGFILLCVAATIYCFLCFKNKAFYLVDDEIRCVTLLGKTKVYHIEDIETVEVEKAVRFAHTTFIFNDRYKYTINASATNYLSLQTLVEKEWQY